MAKKEKQPVHHVQMTEGKRAIIQQLLQEYDIETTEDIQNALKDLLGGTIKEMMEAEMDEHLGYTFSSSPNAGYNTNNSSAAEKSTNRFLSNLSISTSREIIKNFTNETQAKITRGRFISWLFRIRSISKNRIIKKASGMFTP